MENFPHKTELDELSSPNLSTRLESLSILIEYSKLNEELSPILEHPSKICKSVLSENLDESIAATELFLTLSRVEKNNEFMARDLGIIESLSQCLINTDYEKIQKKLNDIMVKKKPSGNLFDLLSLLKRTHFDNMIQSSQEETKYRTRRIYSLKTFQNLINNSYNSTYLFEETKMFNTILHVAFNAPRSEERKIAVEIFLGFTEDAIIRDDILLSIETNYKEEFESLKESIKEDPVDKSENKSFFDSLRNLDILRDYIRPGKEFYDSSEFEFLKIVEDNFETILQEYKALKKNHFVMWPEKYLCKKGWDVFPFFAFKNKLEENCKLCPKTTEILEKIPGMTTAMFSCLQPRTHIRPHIGYYKYSNKILRYHLGIVVPENTALVVNGKVKKWETGKSFVFDDTFRHEAYNKSNEERVVLLIDFTCQCDDSLRNPDFIAMSPTDEDDDALISEDLNARLNEFVDAQNCKPSSTPTLK